MPGHKVFLQDGGEIRDGLACSYCKLLLKDPVQTSESGQRLCKECFEVAIKDPKYASELDPNDQVWPDFAVKKEIGNLKVKCENFQVGCDWKGLFKQLMQHSQECQYVTVECSNHCGQQVLKTKMEVHLKEECNQRRVNCENCGKEMPFIELKDHGADCPNAPKACKNCKKKMPASKLADHMIHECKNVRCVCKSDKTFEAGSVKFHSHLQDSKLADHLMPMISEFTKMSGVFKEMTAAYQQAAKRIDTLEKDHQENAHRIEVLESARQEDAKRMEVLESAHQEDAKRIKVLESVHQEDAKRIKVLEKRNNELEESVKQADKKAEFVKVDLENKVEVLERQNGDLSRAIEQRLSSMALVSKGPNFNETDLQHLEQKITQRVGFLEKHWTNLNNEIKQLSDEIDKLKRQYTVSIPSSKMSAFGGGEILPYEKPSSEVKQLEEKVLELERTLNVISVHHSELELQLQASLASTHNGAFLWRIPEVRRRIRDAKIGRITSIYSPPFYTGRNGYKMCIRAYLNGDGTGEGTHLSIFFVLMKGEYDPLLQWPFESKVSLILVDQDHMKHLVQTFKPNAQSSSFQKPKTDMNVASGCPEFADLSILENQSYVKDDVMYIKAIVDTSKIFHP